MPKFVVGADKPDNLNRGHQDRPKSNFNGVKSRGASKEEEKKASRKRKRIDTYRRSSNSRTSNRNFVTEVEDLLASLRGPPHRDHLFSV